MTARDDLDRHLAAWLTADAPTQRARAPARRGPRADRSHPAPSGLAHPRKVDPHVCRHFPGRDVPTRAVADRRARRPARPGAGRRGGPVRRLPIRPLPPPFGPADNGPIVYPSLRPAVHALGLRRAGLAHAARPGKLTGFFSPTGTQLGYLQSAGAAGTELWVADTDGGACHQVGGPFTTTTGTSGRPICSIIAVQSDIAGQPRPSRSCGTDGTRARPRSTSGCRRCRRRSGRSTASSCSSAEYRDGCVGVLSHRASTARIRSTSSSHPGFRDQADYSNFIDTYFLAPAWSPGRDPSGIPHARDQGAGQGLPHPRRRPSTRPAPSAASTPSIFDPAWYNEFFAQWLPDGHGLVYQTPSNAGAHPRGPDRRHRQRCLARPDRPERHRSGVRDLARWDRGRRSGRTSRRRSRLRSSTWRRGRPPRPPSTPTTSPSWQRLARNR